MPVTPSYPGVYIEELPSTTRTIAAAPTSIAVFVGYTHPWKTTDPYEAIEIFSFTDYERSFGGFYSGKALDNAVPQAVNQFFLNGGAQAYVVGFAPSGYPQDSASLAGVTFTALEPTSATRPIVVSFSNVSGTTADVTVRYGTRPPESYRGVSLDPASADFIVKRLKGSSYVRVTAGRQASFATATTSIVTSGKAGDVTFAAKLNSTKPVTIATAAGSSPTKWNIAVTVGSVTHNYTDVIAANVAGDLASEPLVISVPTTGTPNLAATTTPITLVPSIAPGRVKFTAKAAGKDISIAITAASAQTADITISNGSTSTTYDDVSIEEFLDADGTQPNPAYVVDKLATDPLVTVSIIDDWPQTTDLTLDAEPAQTTFYNVADFDPVFKAESDLDKVPIFNILVLPGVDDPAVLNKAIAFAEKKRAFMILDPRRTDVAGQQPAAGQTSVETVFDTLPKSINGAVYFPYLNSTDPLTGEAVLVAPSGFVAGIFARTDNNRGVWKAPAGLETTILNTSGVASSGRMTDMRQGTLNQKGINCLRTFPGIGPVVFGARTTQAENVAFEAWRYVPVRRMALFIEQTLYRNLGWAVFEPNDEPLWVALRTSVENFMLSLFTRGAFQGSKPSQAFLVKCDASTTTQTDINNGTVNIIVGFAPLKPAEFVIVKIAQLAGQTQ